ncbi:MAG: hypothetical protein A3G49_00910 [Candidatus Sungbacteria bacterium RIFCSPLOWO2_12_FULL_41_11]|uniref:Uncharacterized protein n=1 Tax=Candidatus Sungbacteria bacterium RIFCSPLOWO2_12_FULL_41_11 TaxID=1802286 RepID=A0A1G2LR79_9BACT|nr:MAG: hypothetical protein A3D41_03610 [Candidatus Sungbacteria bacterium RIFCSPHIGHO2_02_FULL_41_12b]OHA13369.1 MAG: hypothetical protein A3G49_00910 [Candidatus Sungbacteria bacterium RIFCSPLOWO2_12_FULL_41_11]
MTKFLKGYIIITKIRRVIQSYFNNQKGSKEEEMAKNFKELRAKMSPERQKRVEAKTKLLILLEKLKQSDLTYLVIYGNTDAVLTEDETEIIIALLEKEIDK